MCGICGTHGLCDGPLLRTMCDVVGYRGPDDQGIYLEPEEPVALGVRRLSIIDLETGHQPIHNEDQTLWLVLNGEIYNYRTLRKDLEIRGHCFYTHSDVETVVHLYEDRGEDCLDQLNGMFSFGLWDKRRRMLFIARDRLGIKPLYYVCEQGKFAFASEIKSLLRIPWVSREIDPHALDAYITLGYVPAPLTILKAVKKLLPGHLLRVQRDGLSMQKYWDLALPKEEIVSEEDCLQGLGELIRDSVRLRLVSDVALGALLSGGIDSSTVVALMSQFSSRVKTFSVGFERGFDETKQARTVARHLGTDHTELIMKPDVDLLPKLIWYLDEPIADQAALPTYLICRLAKSSVTVVLTGEGGDEQFAGYPRYLLSAVSDRYGRLPGRLREAFLKAAEAVGLPGAYGRALRKLTYAEKDPVRRNLDWVSNFSREEKAELYSPELRNTLGEADPLDLLRHLLCRGDFSDSLSLLMWLDLRTWLVDDILMKVDRMSMANSLEARVPFLDHRVVEFSCAIPARLKLRGLTTKYILRRIASPLLPRETVRRSKQAFLVPANLWFQRELREFVRELLLDPKSESRHYFNPKYVERILGEQLNGTRDHTQRLWNLLVLETWHRQSVDNQTGHWVARPSSIIGERAANCSASSARFPRRKRS